MQLAQPVWIGIQGGTCAGKTALAEAIIASLGSSAVLVIGLDRFYTDYDRTSAAQPPGTHNWDHPSSVGWQRVRSSVRRLNAGRSTILPVFDYVSGLRIGGIKVIPKDFIVIEGLWPFHNEYLRNSFDVRIFVDTPADVRLVRRLRRDILGDSRGWSLRDELLYWESYARPMHDEFVEPGKGMADIVLDGEIEVGHQVDVVVERIKAKRR
ncbi:MAG: hypothetical protein ABSG55_01915 [Dehalococcoidia bacterium]